ncbi:hypothetical protein BAY61_15260 [Prauserella marina]|uniref:Uncharacterized protein n=1 Tax=Prauserella marina TaxID=530584 RepID=A0A222VQE2_9PSEU|nr:hypothetical protein [Prauserella marina]ASR36139.1 hypothetical protein BAY61_15260 [Prauserella marina]PWV76879.1 hypothetical protein DES30_10596 [Prauserella marina]SDC99577.1 hypothetical protein SAMN05421630_10597 [Prauserella marina]
MNQLPQAAFRWWRRDVSSTPTRPVWTPSDRPPELFRPVDPPRWVWVDLRGSLRRDPFAFYDEAPGGMQYRYEAKGLLRGWIPAVDGGPLGVVSYQLLTADLQWRTVVTAFVPQHVIRHDSRHPPG